MEENSLLSDKQQAEQHMAVSQTSSPYIPSAYADLPKNSHHSPREFMGALPLWLRSTLAAVVVAIILSTTVLTGCFGLFSGQELPNVVGYSKQDAQDLLTNMGYNVTVVEQDTQAAADLDHVIATNPAPSSSLTKGTTVTLKVGHSSIETREVPNLIGSQEQAAKDAITQTSFFVTGDVSYVHSDTAKAGIVISQDPPAGEIKTKGTGIDLVISLGSLDDDK